MYPYTFRKSNGGVECVSITLFFTSFNFQRFDVSIYRVQKKKKEKKKFLYDRKKLRSYYGMMLSSSASSVLASVDRLVSAR